MRSSAKMDTRLCDRVGQEANDLLGPLVYLQRQEQFTLVLGPQNYQSQQRGVSCRLLLGASVLVILPVLVLYFLAQKAVVRGIATTGTEA